MLKLKTKTANGLYTSLPYFHILRFQTKQIYQAIVHFWCSSKQINEQWNCLILGTQRLKITTAKVLKWKRIWTSEPGCKPRLRYGIDKELEFTLFLKTIWIEILKWRQPCILWFIFCHSIRLKKDNWLNTPMTESDKMQSMCTFMLNSTV